jgi:hypothetical protein
MHLILSISSRISIDSLSWTTKSSPLTLGPFSRDGNDIHRRTAANDDHSGQLGRKLFSDLVLDEEPLPDKALR